MRALFGFVVGIGLVFVLASAQKQTLEARVKQLEIEIQEIKGDPILEALARSRARRVVLKMGEQGFSVAQTSIGAVAMKVKDVQPFAAGCRVSLEVLNLSSAHLLTTNFSVAWDGKGKSDRTTFQEVNALPSGRWTLVYLQSAKIKPDELIAVEVGVVPEVIGGQ